MTGVALVGCSSMPTPDANFVQAPGKAGFGSVYIGRPFGFHTSVFPLPIELDGKSLVSLAPNNYTRVELPPGRHVVAVPNTAWTRAIAGIPHPVDVTVEAGKSYYLMPSRWAGESYYSVTMINGMAIPRQQAVGHSSFSVKAVASSAAPPPDFAKLTYVEAQRP
jgi:hypothetical protein